jgi:hypothetical protein
MDDEKAFVERRRIEYMREVRERRSKW